MTAQQKSLGGSPKPNRKDLPLSETDPKAAKQQATEQKLQLLGTIQAMQRDGRMPHNAQLDELLEKLKTNKVITSREGKMSDDGKRLLKDFRKLIGTMQKALNTKNKEELFQSLVYHVHCMESPINKEHINQSVKSQDKDAVQSEGKKAADSLLKIGKLVLINNEFRSVLGELIDISQDIFNSLAGKAGDSLQNAGDNIQDNSNQEGKSGKRLVDKALDTALNYGHKKRVQAEDPNQSALHDNNEPHLVNASRDDPRHQGLLNTGDSVHPNAIPGGFPTATNTTAPGGGVLGQHNQYGDNHSRDLNSRDLNSAAEDYKQEARAYGDQVRDHPAYKKTQEQYQHHKEYAQETVKEKLPKEKQDELLRRLQNVLAEVQKNPEYQDAINTLVQLIKVWSSRLSKVSGDVTQKAKTNDKPEQANYREQAERELKAIIEIWAQGHSIDPLLQGVQNVARDMKHDDHLRHYYHSVIRYVDRLLREPGYPAKEESTKEGRYLMDQGNYMIKGRYKEHLNYLSEESRRYMNLMSEDPISRELSARIAKIHRDLWMDSEGNPAFKPQLLNDMRQTLLPAFIDEIKYVPIPRIEYSDPQYDIVVENLVLSGDTLLPNIFETKIESFNSFSFKTDTETQPSHQTLFVKMGEIQAEIDDVVFFYKKKTGFPKMSDHGVASLTVGGKGISIALRIMTVSDNPAKTFKVASCKCNVDNLKVKVSDSKHDLLYKTIRPLVIGQIRKQVAKGIEQKIMDMVAQLDQKVTASIVDMNKDLQMKAYNALPEDEKARTKPPTVSQARSRPGVFSLLISIMNRNIKTKVQQRNEAKKFDRLSEDSGSRRSSRFLDNEKSQLPGTTRHSIPGVSDHHHNNHRNSGHSFPSAAEGGIQQYPQDLSGSRGIHDSDRHSDRHSGLTGAAAGAAAGALTGNHHNHDNSLTGRHHDNSLTGRHHDDSLTGRHGSHDGGLLGRENEHLLSGNHHNSGVLGNNNDHYNPGLTGESGIPSTHQPMQGLTNLSGSHEPHNQRLSDVGGLHDPRRSVGGMQEPHHHQQGLSHMAGIHEPATETFHDASTGYPTSNTASMDTNRHNYASPPHSPPKKNVDGIDNNFKVAADLSNAQNEYQQNQMSQRQF